jgi:hypothetical protein
MILRNKQRDCRRGNTWTMVVAGRGEICFETRDGSKIDGQVIATTPPVNKQCSSSEINDRRLKSGLSVNWKRRERPSNTGRI